MLKTGPDPYSPGMADDPAPAVAGQINLFRRFAFIAIGLVGLIFLVVGAWLLLSLGWARATGTVEQCRAETVRTGAGPTNTRTDQVCEVTWEADGVSRSASVNLGPGDMAPGETVELRVRGDSAVAATPAWVGAASAAGGAALVAVAVLLMRRRRGKE